MTMMADIRGAMRLFAQAVTDGQRHVITTQYLYPSSEYVSVYVTPGMAGSLIVSDGGGALDALSAHGVHIEDHKRVFSILRRYQGVKVEGGEIKSVKLPRDSALLSHAVVTVARASAHVAEYGLAEFRPRQKKNLEFEILTSLHHYVSPARVLRHRQFVGKSHRQYVFDFAVQLGRKGTLVVDAVEPEPASFLSKFASHMDIKYSNTKHLEQFIVYDDAEEWKSENLNLLQMAAKLVPLSKFRNELKSFNL